MNEKGRKYEYLFLTLISILFIITMGLSACAKPAPAPSPAPASYPAPAPAPAKTKPTTSITEAQASIIVFTRLINLAQTPEAKEYVGAFLHHPSIKHIYEVEGGCWVVQIDAWELEPIETRDWFPDPDDPLNFIDDHWDEPKWIVFDDGRIMPLGMGLIVEADIDRLNLYRTLAPAPDPVPMPAIKINTISEACDAVDNYIYDLAKTPEAKRLLAEYKENMWSPDSCVVVVDYDQQRKLVYSEWHYGGWDVKQYIIQHIFDSEFEPGSEVLTGILKEEECIYGCGPDDEATYPVTWIVDTYTGTASPENSNAARIVAELMEPTVFVTPPPSLSPTPVPLLPAPPRYFPITDGFTLSPLDEEVLNKYSGWFPSRYPFNEFGIYANRFSFEANETLDIVITSDQPISIEMCDELWGGIYADIQYYYSDTSSRASSSWYESCDIHKSGNYWEAGLTFSPDETGIYSLSFLNRSGKSSWCEYTISLHAASSTNKINTESEVTAAVFNHLSSLATTADAKQLLVDFQENVSDLRFGVIDSEGVGHRIDGYQDQDIDAYAIEFVFLDGENLHGVLGDEIIEVWQEHTVYFRLCSWLVELDGTVQPLNNNALRVEFELMSSTSLVWTYPELHSLGISAEPDFFHETVPREVLENPDWELKELKVRVTELAREYEKAHPYVEPNHVCEHMALELWQIFKDNNITSLIVIGNTENQKEWRIKFECNHAWLVVLGPSNLNLGVECTSGIVYSPSYMRAYEIDCELAYLKYGLSSPQWETAKARYDRPYIEYEQHLEGYFYRSPTAFYGSKALWFIPPNW